MYRTPGYLNAAGHGIECPTCHTVYFLEGDKNWDRMYHRLEEDGNEHWKLLCICSEQTSFQKPDIALYGTQSVALKLGYAVEGQ